MRILIFGKNGQIGSAVERYLSHYNDVIALDRSDADFLEPQQLEMAIKYVNPEVVINAAAYTAVDKAEEDINTIFQINSDSVATPCQNQYFAFNSADTFFNRLCIRWSDG